MSTHLKIISQKDIQIFENPPEFNGEERKKFFSVLLWVKETLAGLKTPINQIGFVIQLGYFRAVNKFFPSRLFCQKDIDFVAGKLQISVLDCNFSKYASTTLERHQELILDHLGYRKFDEGAYTLLKHETLLLCSKQTKPRLMFLSLVDFLRLKKLRFPPTMPFPRSSRRHSVILKET